MHSHGVELPLPSKLVGMHGILVEKGMSHHLGGQNNHHTRAMCTVRVRTTNGVSGLTHLIGDEAGLTDKPRWHVMSQAGGVKRYKITQSWESAKICKNLEE